MKDTIKNTKILNSILILSWLSFSIIISIKDNINFFEVLLSRKIIIIVLIGIFINIIIRLIFNLSIDK